MVASEAPATRREASSNPSRSSIPVKLQRSCSREAGLYARSEIGEDGSDRVKRVDVRAFDARESVRSNSDPRLDPRESVREERESRLPWRLRCGGSSQAGQESDPAELEKRESRRVCG